jgi:hypothetical protein
MEYVTIVRPVCNEPGCHRPLFAKGICATHYMRIRRAALRKKNADLGTSQVREEARRVSGRASR